MINKYLDIDYVKTLYSNSDRIRKRGEFLKNNSNIKFFGRDLILNFLISELKTKSILDIGCGSGYFINQLRFNCSDNCYYAFDIIKNKKINDYEEWLNFKLVDGMNYPEFDKKIDIILCLKVLYHISDLKNIFNWMKNNLNDCGKIFITTKSINNFKNINNLYRKIVGVHDKIIFNDFCDESNFSSENIKNVIYNNFDSASYKISFFTINGQIITNNYEDVINYIFLCPKYESSFKYEKLWLKKLTSKKIFIDNYKETLCLIEKNKKI